jgi:hypothetical protein
LNEGDFTDYYCTAINLLGKATSKIELIELRSATTQIEPIRVKSTLVALEPTATDFSSMQPTSTSANGFVDGGKSASRALDINKSLSNSLVAKSNETVVKVSSVLKDAELLSQQPAFPASSEEDLFNTFNGKTTHKNRIHKLPNYRSNKAGQQNHTKHLKSKFLIPFDSKY